MAEMATMLVVSLVIGGTMAYMQYRQAKKANKRAEEAAAQRNKNLEKQYNMQGAGESTAADREQRKLAYESHIKTQAIAATAASAGTVATSGSNLAMQGSIQDSYSLAAGDLASQTSTNQKIGHMNLVSQQQQTYSALSAGWNNPMLNAMGGFAQGLSIGASLNSFGTTTPTTTPTTV
jgi:hypothetical protein